VPGREKPGDVPVSFLNTRANAAHPNTAAQLIETVRGNSAYNEFTNGAVQIRGK